MLENWVRGALPGWPRRVAIFWAWVVYGLVLPPLSLVFYMAEALTRAATNVVEEFKAFRRITFELVHDDEVRSRHKRTSC